MRINDKLFSVVMAKTNKPKDRSDEVFQLLMLITPVSFLLIPFMSMVFLGDFGDIPPRSKMIVANGVYRHESGISGTKRVEYIDFVTESGKVYEIGQFQYFMISKLQYLSQRNPPTLTHTEGFVLENGSGSFYPVQISDINGTVIFGCDELLKELERKREFDRKFVLFNVIFAIIASGFLALLIFRVNDRLNNGNDDL